MRVQRWLRVIGGRVAVRIERIIDPETAEDRARWKCTVTGFPNPSQDRPAVFFQDEFGMDIVGSGFGDTADQAQARAIRMLRGHNVVIIGQGRDEVHDIPQELRP